MIRRVGLGLAVAVMCLGCYNPPPPGMLCEPIYETGRCVDGSWPEACVAYDASRCGFYVRGSYFACDLCEPLVCDEAIDAGLFYCYVGVLSEDQVGTFNTSDFVDKAEIWVDRLEEQRILESN